MLICVVIEHGDRSLFTPKTRVAGGLFDLQCVLVLSWSDRCFHKFLWVSEFISDSERLMSMCKFAVKTTDAMNTRGFIS